LFIEFVREFRFNITRGDLLLIGLGRQALNCLMS